MEITEVRISTEDPETAIVRGKATLSEPVYDDIVVPKLFKTPTTWKTETTVERLDDWTFEFEISGLRRSMAEVGRPDQMDWRRVSSLRKIAWKTGTSYGSRDAWAIGITPDYVVGVWAGNAEGNSAPGLTGALTAGPVMFDLFILLPPTGWFEEPEDGIEVDVCPESGFLAGRDCPHKVKLKVQKQGVNCRVCPWHREINQEKWFVLPPLMEKYYRIKHQEYRPLPQTAEPLEDIIHFAYPTEGAVLSPARKMDGMMPGIRCEIVHARSGATVYWHLDNEYIGETADIHTMMIEIPLGFHHLSAVDEDGMKEEITIKII